MLTLGLLLAAEPRVPVRLALPGPGPVTAMPCRFGVPLPQRLARASSGLVAVDAYGRLVPVAWTPLLRWPDGSLRWVQGCAVLDFPSGRSRRLWVTASPRARRPRPARARPAGLRVESDEFFHRVRSVHATPRNRLTALFRREGGAVPWALDLAGRPWWADGAGLQPVGFDRKGRPAIARITSTELVQGSPVAVELMAHGDAGNRARFRVKVRIWARSPLLELEALVDRSGAATGCGVAGFAFRPPGPLTEVAFRSRRGRRSRRKKGRRLRLEIPVTGEPRFEVDGRDVPLEMSTALPIALGFGRRWITLAWGDGARRGAARIEASGDRVTLTVRPETGSEPHERRDRVRLTLALTDGPPTVEVRRRVQAVSTFGAAFAETAPSAAVQWGGCLDPIPSGRPGEDPLGRAYRRTLALFLRELDRPCYRTAEDLGDYRLPVLGWANGEYDAIGALLRAFRWTRDHRVLAWTRRAVQHHLDVDLDRSNTGLPRMHGPAHDGGVELGHTWLRGLLGFGLLTGNPEAVDAAKGIARGIVAHLDGTKGGLRHERDYGWSLLALTTAAELFPGEGFAAARDRLARELRAHIHPDGLVLLEGTRNPMVARTTTFVGVGLVAPTLARYGMATGQREWIRLARTVARRYLVEAWDPEAEQMAWSLFVDARSGRVLGTRETVRGGDLLFLAAGLATVGVEAGGGWWRRQAEGLLHRGLKRFERDGFGAHNGDRVRVLHALYELAAHLDS